MHRESARIKTIIIEVEEQFHSGRKVHVTKDE